MNYARAFVGGVAGGAVMSLLMAGARAMGMQATLEMVLGTMLGLAPGTGAWVVGFAMHLVISGLIALLYGWGFERLTRRADWQVGLGFGVVHAVIGGLVMGMVPAMHPLIPEQMPAPGAFMWNLGPMGVVAEMVLHLIYGAIVGAMYGPVRTPGARAEVDRFRRAA